MADSGVFTSDAADPEHQQGMSPTLPVLDGEDHGPNYNRHDVDPPSESRDVSGQATAAPMMNGVSGGHVPPGDSIDARRGALPMQEQPHSDQYEPRVRGGTSGGLEDVNAFMMLERPSAPAISGVSGAPTSTGQGQATMYDVSGQPLFPQFLPSPLPGQSPVSGDGHAAQRSNNWFSRLRDYIQRRVEVTSWSASQSAAVQQGPWNSPAAGSVPVARAGQSPEARAPSVSSGGISAEAVQAEVARQLEAAMGDVMQRLSVERQRTEEAREGARQLRGQLELQERQMVGGEFSRLQVLPDVSSRADQGSGIQPEVPSDLPPRGPIVPTTVQGPLRFQDSVALRDAGGQEWSGDGHLRGPVQEFGVDRNVQGAGIHTEVPSDLPPRGPLYENRTASRPRSQSPMGPKAFLQGLFGLAGGSRDQSGPSRGVPGPSDTAIPVDQQQQQHQHPVAPQLQPQLPLPQSYNQGLPSAPEGKTEGNVLLTLAKGIEALLQQNQSGRQDRPEAVKPGISELPTLAEYQPATGSIDLLNWITHIGPIMEDLSDTSLAWWEATMKDVLHWYKAYSTSPPLARLQLRPQPTLPLKPEWARVERRATAMLLSAVPRSVRDEVIAHGEVTSLSLLCKLYAVYQPGNLQEKSLILKMLEQPDECSSALAAVEALRKWNLWRRRAASVGIAEPDASILLRGLDRITGAVVRGNAELSFRISLIRSTLQIDVCPSASSITSFVQHLQAEMEQQARLGAVKPGGDEAASLKALETSREAVSPTHATPPPPPSATSLTTTKATSNLCRFFASDKGCRRGNGCKYPHTWSLVDKSSRQKKCLNCGAQGHRAKECRAPGGGAAQAKGGSKGETIGASDTGATSGSTPTSEASRRVNFSMGDVQAKVMKVLDDIKRSPLFGPVVASLGAWNKGDLQGPSRRALLDSGATHPLRHPRDEGEWSKAQDVQVQLAGDSTMSMKQTSTGTLLSTQDVSQMIVPLGKVIATLGYELSWTARSCELLGPNNEVLPLEIRNGCPEVSEAVAHQLIQQLEEKQLAELDDATQTSVKMLAKLRASWWTYLKEYVKTGDVTQAQVAIDKAAFIEFKEVVKDTMVQAFSEQSVWELLKALSVNRRARKRLLRAEGWIVRWNPPASEHPRDPLRHLSYVGDKVYVNIGALLINNDFKSIWPVLQWAAINGRIEAVVAKDCASTPVEQLGAAPHRSKLHYLHALSMAARECVGGDLVKLYIEDLVKVNRWKQLSREAAVASWPPWTLCKDSRCYLDEIGFADVSVAAFHCGRQIRVYKLNSDAAWRLHVARNHQPFRRDCSVCVRNSAAGHQHRSTPHPMAYSLSVDVVGPLKGFGRSPDGKFFKYFVIGALRIPEVGGPEGPGAVRGHPIPRDGGEIEEEEDLSEDEGPVDVGDLPGGVAPSSDEVKDEEKQWEELMATFKKPISTTTLYFAVPVNNKKAATMLPAVQRIVTDVKSLGYPVTRLHSDRGGEFRGNLVRKWALSQGMWATTTSGSDSAANGVAESGVRFLKRRARILLDSAGISKENWPTAVQYAAAQQRSEQLGDLPNMPVAYGTRVYVKTKRYKTGAVEDFGPHWTRGRYVGPSTDIRGSHVILKDTGTFIQTTHVRITRDPPPLEDVMPPVIVEPELPEEDPPLPPPALPLPRMRMREKAPVLSKMDSFYPEQETLVDPIVDVDSFEGVPQQLKYLRIGEIQYVEAIAKQLCEEERYNQKDGARLLALFAGTCGNLKVPRAPLGVGMILGAYVHGGSFGVTRYGRDLPWVATYFNNYLLRKLRKIWPDISCSWTTLAIQSAESVPRHKDSHNERGTLNYVMELKTETLDGLWVENRGDERCVVGGVRPRDH